jgi:hypothetical protein
LPAIGFPELVAAGADVTWDPPAVVLVAVERVVAVLLAVVLLAVELLAVVAATDEPAVPGTHCE